MFEKLRNAFGKVRKTLRPESVSWRGAAWAVFLSSLVLLAVAAWSLFPSEPRILSAAGSILGLILFFAACAVVLTFLFGIIRSFKTATVFVVAFALPVFLLSFFKLGLTGFAAAALFFLIVPSLVGGGVAFLVKGGFKSAPVSRKIFCIVSLVFGGAGIGLGVFVFFFNSAPLRYPEGYDAEAAVETTPLALPDPGQPGDYGVMQLYYGSGTDIRRQEYGAFVNLRTQSVDASGILGGWNGLEGWFRTRYWGFDASALPVNGRVWYPQGTGPFPLVLMAHDNRMMGEFSDGGYAYLGELLASRGYIFASVDENFLNSDFLSALSLGLTGLRNDTAARAWLLLEHIFAWTSWNRTPGNPFYNKVDLGAIALIGHSRGAEAAALAAAFNRLPRFPGNALEEFSFRYSIRSVIALAPTDGEYLPAGSPVSLSDVNYLVLQGSSDADLGTYAGTSPYSRAGFSGNRFGFKAGLYIWGANHGQFNTFWNSGDAFGAGWLLLNRRQVLSAEEQRRATGVYVSGFLDATLKGSTAYLPMFRDWRTARAWLPSTLYINQYEDTRTVRVASFEEDVDPSTGTLSGAVCRGENLSDWSEGRVRLADGYSTNRAAFLGWNGDPTPTAPSYRVALPASYAPPGASVLCFALADAGVPPTPSAPEPAPAPESEADAAEAQPEAVAEAAPTSADAAAPEAPEAVEAAPDRQPLDFSVEIVDAAGRTASLTLSSFAPLYRNLDPHRLRFDILSIGEGRDTVFQQFEFPLAAFRAANRLVNTGAVRAVRLVFDRTPSGTILLDDVSFR